MSFGKINPKANTKIYMLPKVLFSKQYIYYLYTQSQMYTFPIFTEEWGCYDIRYTRYPNIRILQIIMYSLLKSICTSGVRFGFGSSLPNICTGTRSFSVFRSKYSICFPTILKIRLKFINDDPNAIKTPQFSLRTSK